MKVKDTMCTSAKEQEWRYVERKLVYQINKAINWASLFFNVIYFIFRLDKKHFFNFYLLNMTFTSVY